MPMNPVSAAELASIRADTAAAACDTPCQVQRATITKSRWATEVPTYTTVASVNAGMSEPTAGQLQEISSTVGALTTWVVRFPYGTDVRIKDRLIMAGMTLIVQAPLKPRSYAALASFLATKMQGVV